MPVGVHLVLLVNQVLCGKQWVLVRFLLPADELNENLLLVLAVRSIGHDL